MLHTLGSMINRLRRLDERRATVRRKKRIERILASDSPAQALGDLNEFNRLQQAYPLKTGYRYDQTSLFLRAMKRATQLLSLEGLSSAPGLNVLEVACGDGMVGKLLSTHGHHAHMVDVDDWRDDRAYSVAFELADVCSELPFESDVFDLVYSYNAFEHFPDPENAYEQIVRVCRPGGVIFLSFGPLYCSPWGMHAYRTIHMPYPQFLFRKDFMEERLGELGVVDLGKEKDQLQFLNGWKISQFMALWPGQCDVRRCETVPAEQHLDLILDYPRCFTGRALSYEDVTTHSVTVCLRKKWPSRPD